MNVPAALPDDLDGLVRALLDQGYEVSSDEAFGDPSFNRAIDLDHPAKADGDRIRLVQNRGLWEIEIRFQGEWYDPYGVVLALDSAPYTPRAQSHAERRRYTLEAIERLPTAPDEIEAVLDKLNEYREAYWKDLGVHDESLHPLLQRVEMAFRLYRSDHDIARLQSSLSGTVAAMEGDVPQRVRLHLERLDAQLDSLRFTTEGERQVTQVEELIGRARAAIHG